MNPFLRMQQSYFNEIGIFSISNFMLCYDLLLKVSRSRNEVCRAVTSSKNERTNLFFYPDSPEILETWTSRFKFQVFPDCQDRKTNSSVRFWKKLRLDKFCFEICWPLARMGYFLLTYFVLSMKFPSGILNIRSLCESQFIFYMTKSDHLMRSEN